MSSTLSFAAAIKIDGIAHRLVRARIHEALFEVPFAVVELVSEGDHDALPEASAVIGKPAAIDVSSDDGDGRSFVGVVVEAERFERERVGRKLLRVRVAPRLWKLGRRADCRIFQDQSVQDIVKKVLDGAGVTDQEWHVAAPPSRPYVVQYRETDLAFVSRLLFEEGIYFGVKHGEKDVVVFSDDPSGLADATDGVFSYRHQFGFGVDGKGVTKVRDVSRVRSDKVTTRDYFFEKPKLKLEAALEGKDPGAHALEVYAYPGRFEDTARGKKLAQILLDSMQCERRVIEGELGALRVVPGDRIEIDDHPYRPLNGKLLVTAIDLEVHFEAEAGLGVLCRFTAIPKTNDYRPPRREVAKTVAGLHTAWTTGAPGSEIHVDKHARVKAKFHWDRLGKSDDKSSTWMRTQQLPLGGAVYLPRVGWEVGVEYLEGDLDRPYVMHRWYNGTNKPPYPLPANKARGSIQTATTPGGGSSNEIRMDDSKGSEEMMINASHDMSVDVGSNATESIGANETHTIGVSHKLNVTNSLTAGVSGSQTVKVGAMQSWNVQTALIDDVGGSHTKSVAGMRNLKVGGDHSKTVSGSSTLNVGSLAIDLVVGAASESTPAAATHNVSAALVEATVNNRSVIVGGVRTESIGAAKIVFTEGGRGVQVKGTMMNMVGGAILSKIKGNRSETAGGTFTEIAAGAHMTKAKAVTYEAKGLVTILMGGSTILVTPANVMILGAGVKFDMAAVETSGLILNN